MAMFQYPDLAVAAALRWREDIATAIDRAARGTHGTHQRLYRIKG